MNLINVMESMQAHVMFLPCDQALRCLLTGRQCLLSPSACLANCRYCVLDAVQHSFS